MGVLYDYFRAPDVSAVAELMKASRGGSPVIGRVADGVDAKGIEPVVTLGKLVAFVLRVPWEVDLIEINEIWPADGDGDSDGHCRRSPVLLDVLVKTATVRT